MKPIAVARAEIVVGRSAASWRRVESRGWSMNEHWTVAFDDGARAFVKLASIPPSPDWLRNEVRVYEAVDGAFMPRFLGWEDGAEPLLVLEDCSDNARFPPPWTQEDIDAVLATIDELARIPAELPDLGGYAGWHDVAEDPAPFLSLGLVSGDELEAMLPELLEAAARTPLAGDSAVHCDLRSDNLCIRDGKAVLFDWNHARRGNSAFDIAFWLPSLTLEGGPQPTAFGGAYDEFAAYVSGFFAALAGLEPQPGAPLVRGFQRAQLEVALPWTRSVLDL